MIEYLDDKSTESSIYMLLTDTIFGGGALMDAMMEFLLSFGPAGMFIHAMIDAIIFPIPAFFLQVSLSALNPENSIWLATLGYVGSLVGTPIGYAIGRTSGNLVLSRFMKKKWLDSATALFRRHGETAILIGSFTPIPFKLFTIMSQAKPCPISLGEFRF
jgi:membrane protein YqaA with SNARE-associated domain